MDRTNAVLSIEHVCSSSFLVTSSEDLVRVWMIALYPLEKIQHFNRHEKHAIALRHPAVHLPIKSFFPFVIFFKPP